MYGLDTDYDSLARPGKDNRDLFQLHLMNLIKSSMGTAVATNVTPHLHTVDGHDVCRIHVHPSPFPVDATIVVDQKGQLVKKTAFFVRTGNSTSELSADEKDKYLLGRWPSA